mgnify:FL=1
MDELQREQLRQQQAAGPQEVVPVPQQIARPPNYKMGEFVESFPGTRDWHIIAGGKPEADWSSRDATEPERTFVPTQLRGYKNKYQSVEYEKRTEPMKTKFKEGMNLKTFQKAISKHGEAHGLDTWHYLSDPFDDTTMLNVVTDYPKFLASVENTATRSLELAETSFDRFDVENSNAGAIYLFNSLSPELQDLVELSMKEGEMKNFICVWIRFLAQITTVSSRFYDDIKDKVKQCCPNQYAQESISLWNAAIQPSIDILQSGGFYDHALTEVILQNLSEGCSVGGYFSYEASARLSKVKAAVREATFMERAAADTYMAGEGLDVKNILREMLIVYNDLHKENKWKPSNAPKDRGALRGVHTIGTSDGVDMDEFAKSIIANLQFNQTSGGTKRWKGERTGGRDKSNDTCNKCGKKGHWASECRSTTQQGGGGRPNSRQPQGNSRSSTGSTKEPNWRRVPPPSGGPETVRKNGNPFYWCGKCRHWNKTHVTSAHVRRPVAGNEHNPDRRSAINLALDPSAWVVLHKSDPLDEEPIIIERRDAICPRCSVACAHCQPEIEVTPPELSACPTCGEIGHTGFRCPRDGSRFEGRIYAEELEEEFAALDAIDNSTASSPKSDDDVQLRCPRCYQFAHFLPSGIMCGCPNLEESILIDSIETSINSASTTSHLDVAMSAASPNSSPREPPDEQSSLSAWDPTWQEALLFNSMRPTIEHLMRERIDPPPTAATVDEWTANLATIEPAITRPASTYPTEDDQDLFPDDDSTDSDRKVAANTVLPKSAHVAATNTTDHLQAPSSPILDSTWLSQLWPFVYILILWYGLPKLGIYRTAYFTGLVNSSQPVLTLIMSSILSIGGDMLALSTSAIGSSCVHVDNIYTSLGTHLPLLRASLSELHWSAYAGPVLWSCLILVASFPSYFSRTSVATTVPCQPRAYRRAVQQNDKRNRRRAAKWKETYRAPRLRGRVYHRPHQKPRNRTPTASQRHEMRSQSAKLSHAQSLLQQSPRFQSCYARKLGKTRGDLRRQYKNVAHTNYSVRSPKTRYSPWSQKLTKGQSKVLKVQTVDEWFEKRQSAFETIAFTNMQNAWKDYQSALEQNNKLHPKVITKLEFFLHTREKFSRKPDGQYKRNSWPKLSPQWESDIACLERGYFPPAQDSRSAKARRKAKVAIISYINLKVSMPPEPSTKQLFYLQESFRRMCNLRLTFWKTNGKKGPSPWTPNFSRHIFKAQKADGSFIFINTNETKAKLEAEAAARRAKVHPKSKCNSCATSGHSSKACSTRKAATVHCTTSETRTPVQVGTTTGFPIIWDSGASVCITPEKNDFITFNNKPDLTSLQGFSADAGQKVEGSGTVRWYIEDVHGNPRRLEVEAYYVPTSRVRLLSTTTLLRTYKGEHVFIEEGNLTLSGLDEDDARGKITAPINKSSDLPVSIGRSTPKYNSVLNAYSVVANENINLTAAEKELLRWHQRLGHIAFRKVQHLMRSGVLAYSESAKRLHRIACRCNPVKCAACQYAKQRARPAPGVVSRVIKDRQGVLSHNQLFPGQEVCVDHFICSNKGRLFTSRGGSRDTDKYKGGAIFVDQATGYVHVEHQTTMTTHSTLRAKESYEAMCRDVGVIPQKYLSDNGTAFTSASYRNHLIDFAQVQRFAGTGAHHHNSRAERAIQTIMSISRAMLMHSFIHWPDMEDTALWPMAVNHAVYLWNHVPDPTTGLCSADLFTKTRFEQSKLLDVHVFGCPVYVLDKTIADGKKIPKWKPRSRRCMYVGRSPSHASTVPLVLNPATGTITPQFHVVFDDWFATVEGSTEDLPDFNSPAWQQLFGDSTYQYVLDDDDLKALTDLSTDLEDSIDSENAEFARNRVLEAAEQLRPVVPLPPPSYSTIARSSLPLNTRREIRFQTDIRRASDNNDSRAMPTYTPFVEPNTPLPAPPTEGSTETAEGSTETAEGSIYEPEPEPEVERAPPTPPQRRPNRKKFTRDILDPSPTEPTSAGRPTRTIYKRKILDPSNPATLLASSNVTTIADDVNKALPPQHHFAGIFSAFQCPISLNAARKSKNNPDILTFDQAMASPDKDKWVKSAELEIKELEDHGCWKEVPLSEAQGHKIVPSQWVFRLKRRPDGTVTKHKGRIVLRGDLMEDIYDVTSPVVAFSTVRLFLIMSLHLGWHTCSVDFSNAFIQAKRPDKVFMHMPRGFKGKAGFILRLIRNVYGACDGPKLWSDLLFKSLRKLGFKQSQIDPCLWYKPNCFIVCFVDDCGIATKDEKDADILIKQLEQMGFTLTKESSFEEFLGIQYAKLANGDVELTQEGLIKKILTATGLVTCNPNRIPAQASLGKDDDGADMTDDWSYPSIIGMLLYLSTNTRPDITFAVSQAARFTHSPKQSHAQAVKTIVRYLAKTLDKGTIVKKPNSAIKLDCYVDADFAGLYKVEADESINSAKSRSGYIIKLGGCPLIWKSQLIPTICLSTAESEYYSLSQSMRALLPIQSLVSEFMERVEVPAHLRGVEKIVHATAHEDNTSALSLATEQRLTSRTRHYHCRWHFFWQAVQTGQVEVIYCETQEQDADYMTKPLVFVTFIANRRRVQGW